MKFAIFSETECLALKEYIKTSGEHLNSIFYLIDRMNSGINGEKNSWASLIKNRIESLADESERKKLLDSLCQYLKVADILRQDPNGNWVSGTLPAEFKKFVGRALPLRMAESKEQKTKAEKISVELFIKSYQNFWDQYLQEILINLIQKLTDQNALSKQHLAKPTIYLLLRLKNTFISQKNLFHDASYKEKLNKIILEKIKLIYKDTKLSNNFILTSTEVTYIEEQKKFILYYTQEILAIRKKYERNHVWAKYVHIHPQILIQFAQLLDYACDYIKKMGENGLFKKTLSETDLAILKILNQKRIEIAMVMSYQEELYAKFGCHDLIQVLQYLLQNKTSDLLPIKLFYDFIDSLPIELVKYSADSAAPPFLNIKEAMQWRASCPILLKVKEKAEDDSKIIAPLKEHIHRPPEKDPSPFCDAKIVLHVVCNSEVCVVKIPKFVMSESIFKNLTTNPVFDFFIKQHKSRSNFELHLNQYKEIILFWNRKVLKYKQSLFGIFSGLNNKEINGAKAENFLAQISNLTTCKQNLDKEFISEYALLDKARVSSKTLEEQAVFNAYQRALDEEKLKIKNYLNQLYLYWNRDLEKHSFLLQDESIEIFKNKIQVFNSLSH